MKLTAWVTIAAVLMYVWIFFNVGKARAEHKIAAPSTDGPLPFQQVMRVQANTVEQLIIFLPLLWLSAFYTGDLISAGLGALWVVGRIMYALGYYQEPKKRSTGFMVSSTAAGGLLLSACIGLILH